MAYIKSVKKEGRKYEYEHYDLGYGMHFGKHSVFGPHVAIGSGDSMVHFYPYKIFFADGSEIRLSPKQQRAMVNSLFAIERRISMDSVPVDNNGSD